ncbi:MAG: hypothetical protein OHK0012_26300 [Synechococcales cyanobacterium]
MDKTRDNISHPDVEKHVMPLVLEVYEGVSEIISSYQTLQSYNRRYTNNDLDFIA